MVLTRPADALSQPPPLLNLAYPLPGLPPFSSPRAPRAGAARPGVALPGWSPAPPPAAPLPSSGSGCSAPGDLPAPQPMGGRRPGPLPFSGTPAAFPALQSPPRAARCCSEARQFHLHANPLRRSRVPSRRAPGPHSPPLPLSQPPLHICTPQCHPRLRPRDPTEAPQGVPRYRGPG